MCGKDMHELSEEEDLVVATVPDASLGRIASGMRSGRCSGTLRGQGGEVVYSRRDLEALGRMAAMGVYVSQAKGSEPCGEAVERVSCRRSDEMKDGHDSRCIDEAVDGSVRVSGLGRWAMEMGNRW